MGKNTEAKRRCVLPSFIAAATASAGLMPIELMFDILHRQHQYDDWSLLQAIVDGEKSSSR